MSTTLTVEPEFIEGKEAYYKLLCSYSLSINPYKDVGRHWACYYWQCGFQQGYSEQHVETTTVKEKEVSLRSWGEDDHIDKYFGRN